MKAIFILAMVAVGPVAAVEIPCPPMPAAVTDKNRDVKSEISASVGSLGRVKAAEIGVKTEITANNLFSKYPHVDRLVALQTMSSTYCGLLRSSNLPDIEKLDRWENFTNRILDLKVESEDKKYVPEKTNPDASTAKKSTEKNHISSFRPKDSPTDARTPRTASTAKASCFVTSANICTFKTSAGQEMATLEVNRGKALEDIPTSQLWDSATYTPAKGLYVVKKHGVAAVYSAPKDALVFDYKYHDIVLYGGGPKHQFGSTQLRDYYLNVSLNGRRGIIDSDGNVIVPLIYDQVLPISRETEQFFQIIQNRKWGLLDEFGREILAPVYDHVNPWYDSQRGFSASVKKEGQAFTVDRQGRRLAQ